MNRRKADLALLFNAFIWGSTFILVKSSLSYISPLLFLAIRFSLATAALGLLFRGTWKWRRRATPAMIGAGCLAGVFLFAGYALQTIGLRLTTAPKSAFLTGLATVMVPLLGALVYRIRPQLSEVFGVLIATFGMALMTIEGPIDSIGRGDLLTLGGAIAFAAHIVTLGHYSEKIGYELLSITQVGAAAVSSLTMFWWAETPRFHWNPVVLWAILITGLFCTALAFTIQAWAQRYTTATRTALIYALEPVVAWTTSFLVVGEGLSGRAAAGAGLILGGVLLVEMKPLKPREHQSR
uniref:EamA domain-containing protein n=1 Tax=Solibacter usitatus (strain Ellin6076) TaxID=234267 RepID=Q024W2_SOLUE